MVINPTGSLCKCYAFANREMAVRADGTMLGFSDLQRIAEVCGAVEFVEEKATDVCALSIAHKELLPPDYRFLPIREHFHVSDALEVGHTSRAKALVSWLENAHFCSHCGHPMQSHHQLTAMCCPECGQLVFPRIEPCIIVLVSRGERILLARHAQRNQNIYACIAGFMEAGETAEEAVAREIYEETHLRVRNIRYFGSQSWPFPSQLMLGFTADYESGEIRVQEEEIQQADWFDPLHCPASPAPGSIAYQLIEAARQRAIAQTETNH